MNDKIMSGRYVLTVLSGVTFLYATWARILTPEAVATIITMVFVSYFNRPDRQSEQELRKLKANEKTT